MSFEHGMGSPLGMFAPTPPGEEITARAGTPLPEGTTVAGEEAVIAALRTVHDPEIPVNIYAGAATCRKPPSMARTGRPVYNPSPVTPAI